MCGPPVRHARALAAMPIVRPARPAPLQPAAPALRQHRTDGLPSPPRAPSFLRAPAETDGYDALQLSALASARIGPGPSGRSLDTPPTGLSHASTVLRSGKPWHKEKYGTHLLLSVDDDGVNHDVVEALVSANGYEARGALRREPAINAGTTRGKSFSLVSSPL